MGIAKGVFFSFFPWAPLYEVEDDDDDDHDDDLFE